MTSIKFYIMGQTDASLKKNITEQMSLSLNLSIKLKIDIVLLLIILQYVGKMNTTVLLQHVSWHI